MSLLISASGHDKNGHTLIVLLEKTIRSFFKRCASGCHTPCAMVSANFGELSHWQVPLGKEIRMRKALEQVVELFRGKERKFEVDEENGLVRTRIEGDNGGWQVIAALLAHDHTCLVLSPFPQKCPACRRGPCAELLTRMNFGMTMGCFGMDYEDGEIRFKTTLPFAQEPSIWRT